MPSVKISFANSRPDDPDSPRRWYVWTRGRSGKRKVLLQTYYAEMIRAGRTEHAENIVKRAREMGYAKSAIPEKALMPASEIVCHHFHGTAKLNPVSADRDFSKIVKDLVQYLGSELGAVVQLHLQIEAKAVKGFNDAARRIVEEKARAIGLTRAKFEK
jgi:hypothetical protein